MELGISFEKLLLIGLIAVLIIGPERLPHYAERFATLVRRAGELLRDTKSRVRDEMGPEVNDVDWRKLDPRQYDPRRIIRDALFEDGPTSPGAAAATATATVATGAATGGASPPAPRRHEPSPDFDGADLPPFDVEAT